MSCEEYVDKELGCEKNFHLQHLANKATYYATPMLICLLSIELFDILFALDSVPLILSISTDPFIIFTATFYSVLGLRSMYFLLEKLKSIVIGLDRVVFCLMFFISFKMIFNGFSELMGYSIHLPERISFIILYSIFFIGIAFNLFLRKKKGINS